MKAESLAGIKDFPQILHCLFSSVNDGMITPDRAKQTLSTTCPFFSTNDQDLLGLKLILAYVMSFSRPWRLHLMLGTNGVVMVRSSMKPLIRGFGSPDLVFWPLHSTIADLDNHVHGQWLSTENHCNNPGWGFWCCSAHGISAGWCRPNCMVWVHRHLLGPTIGQWGLLFSHELLGWAERNTILFQAAGHTGAVKLEESSKSQKKFALSLNIWIFEKSVLKREALHIVFSHLIRLKLFLKNLRVTTLMGHMVQVQALSLKHINLDWFFIFW